MTISKDLFLAILSMDAYNRGYGAGISNDGEDDFDGLGHLQGQQIGLARIGKNAQDDLDEGAAQAAGFYALAYDITGNGYGDLAAGDTVISYRGTDAGTSRHQRKSPALGEAGLVVEVNPYSGGCSTLLPSHLRRVQMRPSERKVL